MLLVTVGALAGVIAREIAPLTPGEKTWVSMAVCFDENTQFHGKSKDTYIEATILSAKTWRERTGVNVVVFVVSLKANVFGNSISRRLKSHGVLVKRVFPIEEVGCPTTSQLVRMGAYTLSEINDDNIVIMSDVDAFPLSKQVLDPLLEFSSKRVWIWQHIYSEQWGFTFPMSFIALRARDWKKTFVCKFPFDSSCLKHWNTRSSLPTPTSSTYGWGMDQRIITRVLLEKKLCSVENQMPWQRVGLQYQPFDDSKTCFHGNETHRHGGMQPKSQNWVHMSSTTTISDVLAVLSGAKSRD